MHQVLNSLNNCFKSLTNTLPKHCHGPPNEASSVYTEVCYLLPLYLFIDSRELALWGAFQEPKWFVRVPPSGVGEVGDTEV